MTTLRTSLRRSLGFWAPLCLLGMTALAACDSTKYEQSTLNPQGDFARMVDHLFMTTVWWALLVFVLVEGALVFAILKYRGKPDDPEPQQIHGNTTVEIIWTVIPALILAMIAVPTVRTIFRTYELPTGRDVVTIEVIGHQWWWEFRYPQYGVTTAGEMHVPVGHPVALKMTTEDVLHSFWVPQFAAKRDVFPNRSNVLWFKAEVAGNFSGQCAEFCGIQHGRMGFRVLAQDSAGFQGFIARLKATGAPKAVAAAPAATPAASGTALTVSSTNATLAPQQPAPKPRGSHSRGAAAPAAPPVDPLVHAGDSLFHTRYPCAGCHSLDATKRLGIGPNLANVGSRSYIAGAMLKNTDENLAAWIQHPQRLQPGVLMMEMGVTDADAKALVAYLRTYR